MESHSKRVIEGHWVAWFGASQTTSQLSNQFVEDNFNKAFLEQVKEATWNRTHFVLIPPGDQKDHSTIPEELVVKGAPVIKYHQKENDNTCLVFPLQVSCIMLVSSRKVQNCAMQSSELPTKGIHGINSMQQ